MELSDSWADLMEATNENQEYKLISSNHSSDENKRKKTETTYNLAEIISNQPDKVEPVKLIEWQAYVSAHLKKYFKQCDENTKFDYNLHKQKFVWLLDGTSYLCNLLNKKQFYHKCSEKEFAKGHIPRSSYKFCEYNHSCVYNYDREQNGCYSQHYAYDSLYADISALMCYIEFMHNNKLPYHHNEIIKCITTISFVFKHMHDEISSVILYNNDVLEWYFNKSVYDQKTNETKQNKHIKQPKQIRVYKTTKTNNNVGKKMLIFGDNHEPDFGMSKIKTLHKANLDIA